jgi:hypothetical protein
MNLRAVRRTTLLALVALSLTLLPKPGPAGATRADAVSQAYSVDEWTDGDVATLPDEPYTRVEVTYDATYAITLAGQVRTSVPTWRSPTQTQQLRAPGRFDRPIVDVTGGATFGMALDDQGHLHTWGDGPAIPAEDRATTYRDVSAAEVGAIGVTTHGEVRYWGAAGSRYPFDPDELAGADVVSVDVDSWSAVAVTADGRVLSGGAPINGLWDPAWDFPASRAGDTFVAADAGYEFAIALTDEGEIVAWGVDHGGETSVPELPAGRHAVAVSGGLWVAAAILDDGSILSWGSPERTVIPQQRIGVPAVDIDLDRYRVAVTYATPAPLGPVTLSRDPVVGEPLTAAVDWSVRPDTVEHVWTVDGTAVGTGPTYTPTAADALGTLAVVLTARREGYADGTAQAAGSSVAPRTFGTTPAVGVTGTPRVGRPLRAAPSLDPATSGASYQWWRGSSPIPGATGPAYTPVPADLGQPLQVRLTVTAPGYAAATATSPATARVGAGAARLRVRVPARVVVGGRARIIVRGVLPGERVTATVGGRTATTTAFGTSATFTVPVTGRPGSRTVVVVGDYADRSGRAVLRVVRAR